MEMVANIQSQDGGFIQEQIVFEDENNIGDCMSAAIFAYAPFWPENDMSYRWRAPTEINDRITIL